MNNKYDFSAFDVWRINANCILVLIMLFFFTQFVNFRSPAAKLFQVELLVSWNDNGTYRQLLGKIRKCHVLKEKIWPCFIWHCREIVVPVIQRSLRKIHDFRHAGLLCQNFQLQFLLLQVLWNWSTHICVQVNNLEQRKGGKGWLTAKSYYYTTYYVRSG